MNTCESMDANDSDGDVREEYDNAEDDDSNHRHRNLSRSRSPSIDNTPVRVSLKRNDCKRSFSGYQGKETKRFRSSMGNYRYQERPRVQTHSWEPDWVPKRIFDVMDKEITKYIEREDNTKFMKLVERMKDLDHSLKTINTAEDFKRVFGFNKSVEMMVFYLATNGTLRSKINRSKKKLQY